MQTYENPNINPQQWTWTPGDFTHRYGQEFSYDANGNILTQTRLDHSGSSSGLIDDLEYHYQPGTNRLDYVTNQETGGGNNQVPDQDSDNYKYDGSGNLVEDCSELLSNIRWNHFGKITRIKKELGTTNRVINFEYNSQQNRVKKQVIREVLVGETQGLPESSSCLGGDPLEPSSIDTLFTLWYIRDATGNVLAVYKQTKDTLHWQEQHLYGSSRLGMLHPGVNRFPGDGLNDTIPYYIQHKEQPYGARKYEITNHLGNVTATLSDRKMPVEQGGDMIYKAVVHSASDYYPFGSLMTERSYSAGDYRYGFNNMEKDDEIKGAGNSYDFSNRIYDSRLGRFLSVDPIAADYPFVSPYNFAENRVIDGIDLWGLQYVSANESFYQIRSGQVWVRTTNFHEVMDPITKEKSIGRSVPRYQINLTVENNGSSQLLGGASGFSKLGDNLRGQYNSAPTIKSGKRLDRRFNLTKAYEQSARKASGLGRVGLAFAAIEIADGLQTTISGYRDHVESFRQEGLITQSFEDVITAMGENKIPSQFHSPTDLSSIANFVFQGEDNFGNREELRNTAIYISKFISGNYRGDNKLIQPESGLDNFKPPPVLIEASRQRP